MTTDLGVNMMPAIGATVGPEDALAPGPKRGDYSQRVGPPNYHPHTGLVPQRPFAEGNLSAVVPEITTVGNDATTFIYTAPYALTVKNVWYVPDDDITGAATNNRKLSVINLGVSGSDSVEMAALAFGSGMDATEGELTEITVSGTPANRKAAKGETLSWKSLHVGTGIADPGGTVFVIVEAD